MAKKKRFLLREVGSGKYVVESSERHVALSPASSNARRITGLKTARDLRSSLHRSLGLLLKIEEVVA